MEGNLVMKFNGKFFLSFCFCFWKCKSKKNLTNNAFCFLFNIIDNNYHKVYTTIWTCTQGSVTLKTWCVKFGKQSPPPWWSLLFGFTSSIFKHFDYESFYIPATILSSFTHNKIYVSDKNKRTAYAYICKSKLTFYLLHVLGKEFEASNCCLCTRPIQGYDMIMIW